MNRLYKYLIILIGIVLLAPLRLQAASIKIDNVTLDSKSENVTVLDEPSISGTDVSLGIKFNEIDDYAKFKLEIKNNDTVDYTLENDSYNEYLSFTVENTTIKSKKKNVVYLTVKLIKKVPVTELDEGVLKTTISLGFKDKEGKPVIINPKTGDNLLKYLIIFIVSVIGLNIALLVLKKKNMFAILIGLLLIPFIVKAANEIAFKININFNIELNDNVVLKKVTYKVIHKKMNLDGSTYSVEEEEELEGIETYEVTPNTNNYDGFTSPTTQTVVVDSDGTTKIVYEYERNKVEVTLPDNEYITGGDSLEGEHYYGEEITLEAKDREGYDFVKWSDGSTENPHTIVLTNDLDIYPIYSAKTNIAYTVKHYKMDLDGVNYTLAETDNLNGTTDENVTPNTRVYEGFNSPEKQTKKIKADGSTLFEYYYTRIKVEVNISTTTNSEYITSSLDDGEYYYGEQITLTASDREGYDFDGWSNGLTDKTIQITLIENLDIYPTYTPKTNIAYTVKHYKMDLDGVNYTLSETENLTGTTDANVTAAVRNYDGFTAPQTQTKKINANGSTLFEYYYTRNKVEVDLDSLTNNEYVTSSLTDGDHYYGEEITLTAQDRPGYTFDGWSNGSTNNPYTFELTEDLDIYPIYTAKTNIAYTVKHYKMDTDGVNYTLSDTDNLTGTTDTNVTPSVKNYDGFTAPQTQTKKINGNGSTLFEYYYTRNKVEVDMGSLTNNEYVTSSISDGEHYYGEEITLTAQDRPGYTFDGWSDGETNNPYTFELTEDLDIYPIYTAKTNTTYTVKHYKMNLDGENYTLSETENLTGTTDTNVTPGVKNYDGFTAPETQTTKINGDGTTIIEYNYTRNKYSLNITDRTYLSSSSTENGNYYYETPIIISAIDRDGYTFNRWSNNNTNQTLNINLTSDLSIYPIYTANTNTAYTVLHKKKDLGSNTYTTFETDNLTGTTDTNVTPSVKEYDGFTAPETQTKKINGDGSTTFEYLYNRKSYTFEISNKTYVDTNNTTEDGTYEYGKVISIKAIDRQGYTFEKWSNNNTSQTTTFELTSNTSIYPIYVEKGDTPYTVLHKKKDLGSNTYTLADTDELTGKTNVEISPAVKEYTGFISPSVKTTTIKADGSTVVEYLYNREVYTLNITDRTYLSSTSTANGEYEYETPIVLSAIDRDGYTFNRWSNNNTNQTLSFGMSEDVNIYPIYTANTNTAYTVKHYKMNIDGENYTLSDTDNLIGTTDTNVTPSVKEYDGFTAPQTQTKKINGNGSTLFEYYYTRNKVEVDLDSLTNKEYVTSSLTDGEHYYGEEITLTAVDRPGYTFTNWSDGETDNPYTFELTEDLDIYPIYTANTNTSYTVYHKWQNLTGEEYTTHETENLTGTTDTNVTPSVREYIGFESPTTQTKKINGDGSTVFEYKYDRITYTLNVTDRTYLTSGSTANGSYRYGTQIIISAVDRPGYDFTKWSNNETSQTLQFTISENITIYPVYTAKTNTAYTVKHYKMNLDGENYTLAETNNLTGTTDTNVTPSVREYDGFTAPQTQTKKINGNGSTLFEYYYTRNKVEVDLSSLTNNEYVTSSLEDGDYYYGTEITLTALEKVGYTFTKWSDNSVENPYTLNLTDDLDIYPIYVANTNTAYTVKHYKMNTDGETYALAQTENLTGTTDTNVTPSIKDYDGFTSPSTQTKKINGNGSTLFEYYYTRNKVDVDLSSVTNSEYITSSLTDGEHYYGEEIVLTAVNRPGYTFTNWSDGSTDNPHTITLTEDLSIYPVYTANTNTAYTVKHYKMNLDGENYTLSETENLTGTTDTNVTPGVKTYDGFTAPATQTKKINGNGSTLIEYHYTRNKYTLNVTDRTYLTSASTANGEYYYETPITLSAVDRAGYTFSKWSNNNTNQTISTTLTGDLSIYPIYTANTNTAYTVKHYKMNLDGENYTLSETENLTGTTDTNVTPGVKTYDGFTAPETQTKKINGNGSTLIEYYYTRNKVTIDLSSVTSHEYIESSLSDGEYYYGTEVTVTAKEKEGYTFVNWSNNETDNPYTFELTENINVYPIYAANVDTTYIVKHYKMNLDGANYTLADTDNLQGETDTNVTPGVKNYEHFTSPETQTKKINANGSTVFEYYYTRNKYNLNVTDRTYLSTSSTANGKYYYETPITLSALDRVGYVFDKWSNNISSQTIQINISSDIEIYPIYITNELVFNNQTLDSGVYNTAYTSNSFNAATNGTGSYTYSIKSGAPSGTTINSTNRTITLTNNVDAGTYNIVITATDNNSNKTADAIMTITIDRKPIAFPTCSSKEYNGESQTLFSSHTSGEYTNDVISGTNVGSYSTNLTPTSNYKWNSGSDVTSARSLSCSITQKDVTVTAASQSRAWNNSALTNSTCTAGSGQLISGHTVSCTMTSSSTITTAGSVDNVINTYSIKNSSNTDVTSNYNVTTAKGTLTITLATPTVSLSAKSEAQRTYIGSAITAATATVSPDSNPTITYKYYTNNVCSENETTIAPTNAGTYYAKAYASAVSGKTNAANSDCVNHTIVQATGTNSVAISGTNTWGQTLTATITTNSPGTKSYQWYYNSSNSTSGGTAISGATSNTYTISKDYVGKYIYVVASVGSSQNYTTPSNSTAITSTSVAKQTSCAAPTNVSISTAGVVTWTASPTASGYQISIDDSSYTDASSGVNYNSTITNATGERIVYVRSKCDSTYYTNANSSSNNVSTNVFSVTLTKGTGIASVTGAGNYISGSTVTLGATVSSGYAWSKWTQTSGGADVSTTNAYSNVISSNWAYTANSILDCKGFSTASWSTIKTNVSNDLSYYPVGCTKSVDLGSDLGTHTLRVANNTRPSECETSGFSQTSCGFVVEFEDIITSHIMNPYSQFGNANGDGNRGGWEYSEMRTYVNNDIYNALPSELKSVIIDTYVVSGHGSKDSTNFTTTDKLYLFSTKEIWGKEGTSNVINYDSAETETRQLDYYKSKNVTTSNYTKTIKKRNGSATTWWLRSAYSDDNYYTFFGVSSSGYWLYPGSDYSYGVSPSFRIDSGLKYRVTLNPNGGSVTPTYIDVTAGSSVGTLPTPTPEDEFHEFIGWYTGIDSGVEVTSSYIPTGNIEIFARWNDLCKGFSTASWSTIQTNVNNDLGYYGVGCTKSVTLGSSLGTHTLRVANNTRPAECETSGFSQTACGFVIEFADIITTHRMNPYSNSGNSNGDGNRGGWEYSDMRAYVNSGKYLAGTDSEIDYSSNGIYSNLPSELKSVIIDTYVVSGHGPNDSANFTTTDKIYLFSPHEIWNDVDGNTSSGIDYVDKSYSNTRQLDYYLSKNVTTSNYSAAIKKKGTSNSRWWLRSARSNIGNRFFTVDDSGAWGTIDGSSTANGVTPSFRIDSGLKYRVTLNPNGGSVTPTYIDVTAGSSVGTLPTPTPVDEFHEFLGWYTGIDTGVEVTSSYIPTGNIEIFARWDEDLCKGFSTASWSTIQTNVNSSLDYYPLGCTKPVDLGSTYGTHNLRVANNTRPSACNAAGFSQTACGFVLEFVDSLTTGNRMNPYTNGDSNGDGNRGGWQYSEMRTFVNNDIYNALPSELKNVMIDTIAVSSYGSKDSANFTTTDKLYLLSSHEVWEDTDGNANDGIDYYDKAYSNTRQLDYYNSKGVTTTNNYSYAIKKIRTIDSYWWLRSARALTDRNFLSVKNTGEWGSGTSSTNSAVSPAFRISSGIVKAENLSYDNTNTGINCSDVQCVLDYISGLLN